MTDKKCTGPDALKPEPCPDFKRKPLDLSQFEGHTPGDGEIHEDEDGLHVTGCTGITACYTHDHEAMKKEAYANANLFAHADDILTRARELEAEAERLDDIGGTVGAMLADTEEQLVTLQSHAASLAGALELFINADPTWASDGDGVMEVTWIAFAKARAALAAWKQAQGTGVKDATEGLKEV